MKYTYCQFVKISEVLIFEKIMKLYYYSSVAKLLGCPQKKFCHPPPLFKKMNIFAEFKMKIICFFNKLLQKKMDGILLIGDSVTRPSTTL